MNNYQIKRIAEALDKSKYLTVEECGFIARLSILPDHAELTKRQNHRLNQISEKMR